VSAWNSRLEAALTLAALCADHLGDFADEENPETI
jgi:hypothetical protein